MSNQKRQRECKHCGTIFDVSHGNQKYCLNWCAARARNGSNSEFTEREGRSEYLAARYLYEQWGIVTFPSPHGIYDLFAVKDKIRIEVKFAKRKVDITKRQTKNGSFDIAMIYLAGEWIFKNQADILMVMSGSQIKREILNQWRQQPQPASWAEVLVLSKRTN